MEEETNYTNELMSMSKERLQYVEHEKYFCLCSALGCCRKTEVRDYGISPIYWTRLKGTWLDLNNIIFLCAKHYPILKGNFDANNFKAGPAINQLIKK